jgi:aspartyl-tRNA(Asn)/glutamyl-tRNA(Gln) amidotransferase subunit A
MDGTKSDKPVQPYASLLKKDVKGLRVGLPKEYFIDGLRKDVEQSVRDAAKVLQSLGATLVDISLPHTKYALATYYVLCPCEVSSNMARYDGIRFGHTVEKATDLLDHYQRVRGDGFGSEVKRRIMIGTFALSSGYYDAYYLKAQKVRTLVRQDFDEAFKKVDIIIAPVSPHAAFKVGANSSDPLAMYLEDVFMDGAVMGGIPALSVQCGFTTEKMPLGLQIMGPQWGEATILSAAHAFQSATEWHARRPAL